MERPVITPALSSALTTLLRELVDGTPPTGGYMLNRGDRGLLASVNHLSASEASAIIQGGSSIAAHVDHCTYYFSLMNRWASGEPNPWRDADWKASWARTEVSTETWAERRRAFEAEARQWMQSIGQPRDLTEQALTGIIASVAHLAYHLGAIRQMDRTVRGPSANNEPDALTSP